MTRGRGHRTLGRIRAAFRFIRVIGLIDFAYGATIRK